MLQNQNLVVKRKVGHIDEFEIESLTSKGIISNDTIDCGSGSADRSAFGPFGILAIVDDTLSEQTPVYFRLSNTSLGDSTTFFCVDETRSSKAPEVAKIVQL
ncbi:beta-fructofuranosidase [Trifolium repens]|nr:beta-fructofuranosidase [Trifolium repens]